MNPKILISVVICTRNRERYLRLALESLDRQTLPKDSFEVLVIDNGSKDGTFQTATAMLKKFYNSRYFFEEVPGHSRCRNIGWRNAAGDYVAYLDDDAVADKRWLEKILDAFKNKPEAACVGGPIRLIWETAKPVWLDHETQRYLTCMDYGYESAFLILPTELLVGANIAFPRKLLKEMGGFSEKLGRKKTNLLSMDENFLQRQLYERGYPIYYNRSILVWHHATVERVRRKWFFGRHYWEGRSKAVCESLNGEIAFSSWMRKIKFSLRDFMRVAAFNGKAILREGVDKKLYNACSIFEQAGYFIGLIIELKKQKEKKIKHKIRVVLNFIFNFIKVIIIKYFLARGRQFIGIGQIEHMGDILASEPILRHIRAQYPKAYLIWALRKPYRELIQYHPSIDRIINIHCLDEWVFLSKKSLFDLVIDLHIDHRMCEICLKPLKKHGAVKQSNYFNFGNLLSVYCRIGGIQDLREPSRIFIPKKIKLRVSEWRLPQDYLVIHGKSNELSKDWPPEKWQVLAERLLKTGYPIVEVGEFSILKSLKEEGFYNYCGKTSLLELAELIRNAKLFIGVDSGPSHIANAMRTPGIILLGSYRTFRKYMPYNGFYADENGAQLIYRDGPCQEIPLEDVYEAVIGKMQTSTHRIAG